MAAPIRALPSLLRTLRTTQHTRLLLHRPLLRAPTTPTRFYSTRKQKQAGNTSPFPILALIAVFGFGTGAFFLMVEARKDTAPPPPIVFNRRLPPPPAPAPTFSPELVTVVFVLGGPGAGKGTQCANVVRDYGFVHLSAGDLLREEQEREGSEFGELIRSYIEEGKIVPMEVTIALLENAMHQAVNVGRRKFLIDGFPRKLDQALKFESEVCPSAFTLFFDCGEEVMLGRLLKRGETSGRIDDNIGSIRKRFATFRETSYSVVEHFKEFGKVVDVDATKAPEEVYADVRKVVEERLGVKKA